jgi:hypothetical protein
MDGSKRKYGNFDAGANQRKKGTQPVQYNCDHDGCGSTFGCHFNLVRHKQVSLAERSHYSPPLTKWTSQYTAPKRDAHMRVAITLQVEWTR